MDMEEYGFATLLGEEEYQLLCSKNLDELFNRGRHYLPIRSRFERYLQQGLTAQEGYLIITDPEPDQVGGEDGFEIIIGQSRAVTQYVLQARNKYLENKVKQLVASNQQAAEVIRKVADGVISPEQLKKVKDKIIPSAKITHPHD